MFFQFVFLVLLTVTLGMPKPDPIVTYSSYGQLHTYSVYTPYAANLYGAYKHSYQYY